MLCRKPIERALEAVPSVTPLILSPPFISPYQHGNCLTSKGEELAEGSGMRAYPAGEAVFKTWIAILAFTVFCDFGAITLSLNLHLLGSDIVKWLGYTGLVILALLFTPELIALSYYSIKLVIARNGEPTAK